MTAKSFKTCGAKNKQGDPCKRSAGWGTDHRGVEWVSYELLVSALGTRVQGTTARWFIGPVEAQRRTLTWPLNGAALGSRGSGPPCRPEVLH